VVNIIAFLLILLFPYLAHADLTSWELDATHASATTPYGWGQVGPTIGGSQPSTRMTIGDAGLTAWVSGQTHVFAAKCAASDATPATDASCSGRIYPYYGGTTYQTHDLYFQFLFYLPSASLQVSTNYSYAEKFAWAQSASGGEVPNAGQSCWVMLSNQTLTSRPYSYNTNFAIYANPRATDQVYRTKIANVTADTPHLLTVHCNQVDGGDDLMEVWYDTDPTTASPDVSVTGSFFSTSTSTYWTNIQISSNWIGWCDDITGTDCRPMGDPERPASVFYIDYFGAYNTKPGDRMNFLTPYAPAYRGRFGTLFPR